MTPKRKRSGVSSSLEILKENNRINIICYWNKDLLRNDEIPDHFRFDGIDTITVAVYTPSDKHALDRHGEEKVLLVENTVGRNINRRRGEGSLSVLDVIDANRRAGSRGVGTSHGIGSEFITHGSSSGRGLSGSSVGGRNSGSRIGSSGLVRNVDLTRNSHLETIGSGRGVSDHSGVDVIDAISSRRGGRVVLDTVSVRRSGSPRTSGSGFVSQSVLGGKSNCKSDCFSDGDCPTNRYCATVNCHRICRRRLSNGYSP
ncbi:Hypothetical predicted protein [Mytilus galloprovincialis]|uniref:WAP domain-containing protein n=1 Tax=Mytilus galloprovincialis TaxID=29158 RepID=A0A8B6E506_MYTGA|nr:Hypothetical predicted protein [Mytilus galloprovincialis]